MGTIIGKHGVYLSLCILVLLFTQGCKVTVPNVVDMPESAARSAIKDAKLDLKNISMEHNDTVILGNVISQNPAGGEKVGWNTKVSLTVSKGVEQVNVPNVVGTAWAAAETAITGAKLVVGEVSHAYSDTYAAGTVVSQNPAGGAVVDKGSKVDFTVSKGPNPFATLVIVNLSSETIVGLYVSLSTDSSWGPNRLSSTIPIGSSFTLNNIVPGTYDVLIRTASGRYAGVRYVPLRAGETVRINVQGKKSNEQALEIVLSDEALKGSASAVTPIEPAEKNFGESPWENSGEVDGDHSPRAADRPHSVVNTTTLASPDTNGRGDLSPENLDAAAAEGGCSGVKSLDGLLGRVGDLFLTALGLVIMAAVPSSLNKH